jgi:hypothetical protein
VSAAIGAVEPLPKVTPYLLRRAADGCPRRLDMELRAQDGNRDPVNRGRVREAFLDEARTVHTLHPRVGAVEWPPPPPWLVPEELRVLDQAVHWYRMLFGDREVTLHDHDLHRPSAIAGTDVRIGGWVDLTVVGADGRRELRQLDLWGRPAPTELLADWSVRTAVVRLADWLGDGPVRVSWTDLLHGIRREEELDAAELEAGCRDALDARIEVLRERADAARAEHGADCGSCAFHKGCPQFPRAMRVGMTRRDSLLPGVLSLTPSALEAWDRCPRLWRNQYLLQVPPSDEGAPAVHGQQVHDLLRLLHLHGPCDDPTRIDDVVAAHGASARVHAELTDHARRCPIGAESYGHEITRVRLHSRRPSFVASARIDAAWIHDGLLDVRDYKTGGAATDRVADDRRARLQAWVMAEVARDLGLRLRLRYEQLAAEIVDDPEEWEPDDDDLDAISAELVEVVEAMRAESVWSGIADPGVCGYCRYRSVCPDSAAPGIPGWPRVDEDADRSEGEP